MDNLRYLTGNHMLADIPHLILKVKQDLKSENSRVIVFGARESGTIAALARKKFPHIVDGVWSSSGIFRAFTPDLGILSISSLRSIYLCLILIYFRIFQHRR